MPPFFEEVVGYFLHEVIKQHGVEGGGIGLIPSTHCRCFHLETDLTDLSISGDHFRTEILLSSNLEILPYYWGELARGKNRDLVAVLLDLAIDHGGGSAGCDRVRWGSVSLWEQ